LSAFAARQRLRQEQGLEEAGKSDARASADPESLTVSLDGEAAPSPVLTPKPSAAEETEADDEEAAAVLVPAYSHEHLER
jgi:hypothetical protein